MKRILSFFVIIIFSLSIFCHSVGIVFAESIEDHHCHSQKEEKPSWDCCLISKDFGIDSSFSNIKTIKISKLIGGDFLLRIENESEFFTKKPNILNRKSSSLEPPSNTYVSLIGIVKQLK